jgi:hypothetical protein
MNLDEQDQQLRSPVARASSPCFGQAGSLSYHFLVGSRITDFVRQISLARSLRSLYGLWHEQGRAISHWLYAISYKP